MQLPTHCIVGIIIQILIITFIQIDPLLQIVLVAIVAFLSHFFIDAIALVTYHPPVREESRFWFYWHVFVYLSGIIIIILFWNIFFIGMFFANLVDIWDWLILRNISNKKNDPSILKKWGLHKIADKVRQPLIKTGVPNLNHNRLGIIPELLLIISFFVWITIQALL